jgi:putative Mn2+ efflux pump MntP
MVISMKWNLLFFFNSILLGIGLAMDAFSVSLANGLHEPQMKRRKMWGIAGTFALFQAIMPMTGWICVHTIVRYIQAFEQFVPWIAFALLLFIGGKMLLEGIRNHEPDAPAARVGLLSLFIQAVATSIDALSVGFTIADYNFYMAGVCVLIIALVTFVLCMAGLLIGKKFSTRFSDKAAILGGSILIVIGLEIFIAGVF